ncbi:MAG: FkbM family methyltransferase [Anaerolineae bacterium]|nr:FkbM family methyltransferase [Anaerolineae bacterium]
MNLSGISDKSLFGKLLRLPLRLIPPQTVVPILQGRLRGKKWIAGSSLHGFWLGTFEHDKRIVFEQIVKENSVVFDVGAHVGYYTLLASALVGPGGRVFAFEPLPANLVYLKEHLRLNNVENVTVIEAAVSNRCGAALFEDSAGSAMGRLSPTGKLQVETVTLDELTARGELPPPDCIKIDIEGGEAAALSGAASTLAQYHPVIFLATHGESIHHGCCRLLRSLGYELQPLDGKDLESSDELLAAHHASRAQIVGQIT